MTTDEAGVAAIDEAPVVISLPLKGGEGDVRNA
jgi:hypothetical protein